MSSGSLNFDNFVTPSLDCGPCWIGVKGFKIWNGADDPVKHKQINPYSMEYEFMTDGVLTYENRFNPGVHTGTWFSCFGGFSDPPLPWSSNDDLALVNKLGDRIRNHEFNAAVSLGAEGKEALEQIAHAASSMYKGIKNLRKGNVSDALREFGLSPKHAKRVGLHKDLSGKVLATQLGWIPLMADVKSGYEAVLALTAKPQSMTYHATRRLTRDMSFSSDSTAVETARTLSKRLSWTLSENFSVWESMSLSDPWDFADAAWNATTLSFIADWFIPVGSYLSARSIANKLNGSGYLSTFDESTAHGVGAFWVYTINSSSTHYRRLRVNRTVLSNVDSLIALPRFKDFNKIPSWRRALTATALATQMFL